MRAYLATIALTGAFALAMAACSSSSGGGSPAGGITTGNDAGNGAGAGTNLNPDGVPYPVPDAGYGRTARSGSTPGSVLQNFKFQGRLAGSTDVTTISLADYYDPCNKRAKILHISVAAVWCEPCSEETAAIVTDLASSSSYLNTNKITFIQALDDGPTEGTPATVSDLNYWISNHNSNFDEMLDPGLQNFGGFFNAAAIPWNCDVDVRTMEILDSSEGWAGDVQTEMASGLAALPTDPSYPIPAAAGCGQ